MEQREVNSLQGRMVGAAMLDARAYEAVERDVSANKTALLIVVLSAIAAGIGDLTNHGLRGLFSGVIAGLVSWVLYAAFAYIIGTTIFKTARTSSTLGELLRTLGFAQVPGFLLILSGIFLLGPIVNILVFLWILATTVVAIRQALDFTAGRAIGTAVVAWFFYIIPYLILLALL